MKRASAGTNQHDQQIVLFLCPGCLDYHQALIAPGQWSWNGSESEPTLGGSVLVQGPMRKLPNPSETDRCHSYVTDGRIAFLGDSTHPLSGQTVDLPEWPHG